MDFLQHPSVSVRWKHVSLARSSTNAAWSSLKVVLVSSYLMPRAIRAIHRGAKILTPPAKQPPVSWTGPQKTSRMRNGGVHDASRCSTVVILPWTWPRPGANEKSGKQHAPPQPQTSSSSSHRALIRYPLCTAAIFFYLALAAPRGPRPHQ